MDYSEKYINQSVGRLDVRCEIIDKLENAQIGTLGQLSKMSKSKLKEFDLSQKEIEKVEIEMQLLGLGLKNSLWPIPRPPERP